MTLQAYLQAVFDPQRPISSSKLLSLSGLSDAEVVTLRVFWEQAPEEQRARLVGQLATLAEDNAEADFTAVFRVALDDPSPAIRAQAIDGLWECQERWLLNRLITLVAEDVSEEVRAAAVAALGKFVLLGVFQELRAPLAEKVEAALKGIIANEHEAVAVRRRAIESLSPSPDPSINDIIRDSYHSQTPGLKQSAIYAMGQHCDAGWLPVLLAELKNPEPAIRFEAARACGELEDPRAVPSLIELTKEQDAQVQEAAIEALGHIGGEEAQRALRQCLAQPDPRVQEAARAALEELAFGEDPLGLT